jgi:hypothetical protein
VSAKWYRSRWYFMKCHAGMVNRQYRIQMYSDIHTYLTDRVSALPLVSYFYIQTFFRLYVLLFYGMYGRYRCGLVRSALTAILYIVITTVTHVRSHSVNCSCNEFYLFFESFVIVAWWCLYRPKHAAIVSENLYDIWSGSARHFFNNYWLNQQITKGCMK